MILLHQIGDRRFGSNFNNLKEILDADETLSFDGVYASVYENYRSLKGKDVTFFVSGKYLGGDNSFDVCNGQPLSKFCTLDQIFEMRDYLSAEIGYHGWAHLNCQNLSDDEVIAEITPPDWLTSKHLAWPYGNCDRRTGIIAMELGYTQAWSVTQGNDSVYQRRRIYLNW